MPFFSRLQPMMRSLLNGLLGALEKDEREVVSGDLLEAHESPSASVSQVLGLILRRQIIHWADWRPWIVLTTIAIPLAVVLSQTAREFARWSAVYSWMLVNNTDAALLRNAGFWRGALEYSWAWRIRHSTILLLMGLRAFDCTVISQSPPFSGNALSDHVFFCEHHRHTVPRTGISGTYKRQIFPKRTRLRAFVLSGLVSADHLRDSSIGSRVIGNHSNQNKCPEI